MAEEKVVEKVERPISPREEAMKEIVADRKEVIEAELKETLPATDEDGNTVEPTLEQAGAAANAAAEAAAAAEEAPPAEEVIPAASTEKPKSEATPASTEAAPFDVNAEYEIEVDGQKIKVPGAKILDAGRRTFQKETAADFRLDLASRLLEEAKRKTEALPAQGAPKADAAAAAEVEVSDADLAKAIQYGTQEEATKALSALKKGGKAVTPEQVMGFVSANIGPVIADQLDFRSAVDYAKTEYKDILDNDYLRRLFFVEENRRRAPKERGGEGDTRPYRDLYKSIGDDLRTSLKLTVPTKVPATLPTKEERQAAKEKAPTVPTLASARIEAKGPAKPATHIELINKMRAARGQAPLN